MERRRYQAELNDQLVHFDDEGNHIWPEVFMKIDVNVLTWPEARHQHGSL